MGLLAGLAALVILIIYLVKINQIAGELGSVYGAATAYPAQDGVPPTAPPYPGQDDYR